MPHQLNFTQGRADFITVGKSAWHKEGIQLPSSPSYEEALALAHLDYEVEKRQTFLHYDPDGMGTRQKASGAWVTVRTDTYKELGRVSREYRVVQNREAFRVLEPLIGEGLATVETAGVLRDGADAWLLVRWNIANFPHEVQETFGGQIIPYALVANNHAGRRGVLLALTPIRVVCANTLGMAESYGQQPTITVSHTTNALERLSEAAEDLFGDLIKKYTVLAAQYQALRASFLTEDVFQKLVLNVVAPDPRDHPRFSPDARLAERVVARADEKRDLVSRLWDEGAGHIGDRSAWEAYNAAVEALDHHSDLFPTRAGTYRTASLLDGRLKQMKQTVLNNIVAHAYKN